MAPGALTVMQHNAAVAQPLGALTGGAWHGHSAPAAPARPHPGPGLPLAEAQSRFYPVMLLQLYVGAGGPGHLPERGGSFLWWGGASSSLPACLCLDAKGLSLQR